VIAGPTASGKSALGLALAERIGGVLVNADSAQVYRGLSVLSAAPSDADRARAEHRLYGVLDGTQPCSAADWAEMARHEIADIHGSGRTPILVGGTGLYLRTLLDGIAPVPAIDPDVRKAVRSALLQDNRRKLQDLDPEGASRINSGDSARTARALEVVVSTGRTLQQWQAERGGGIAGHVGLAPLVLLPPRQWLYERCDRRFMEMANGGAVEEVKALLAQGLDPALPIMRAIGVAELSSFIRKELSFEAAIAAGQRATRRYAKRQYTWFAHQPPPEWTRFPDPVEHGNIESALARLCSI